MHSKKSMYHNCKHRILFHLLTIVGIKMEFYIPINLLCSNKIIRYFLSGINGLKNYYPHSLLGPHIADMMGLVMDRL